MKELSKEEFEKNVLKLNGTMTTKIFENVLMVLKELKILSANTGEGYENDVDVFNYLGTLNNNSGYALYLDNNFPCIRNYYKYKDIKFIWEVVFGQGSDCSLLIDDDIFEEDKQVEIKEIDTELKFYKVV